MHLSVDAIAPFSLRILTNIALRGGYGLLRLCLPDHAPALVPGQSMKLHFIDCDNTIEAPLFRCDPQRAWCEVLYRAPSALSNCKPNESIDCDGVAGAELANAYATQTILMLGSDLGLAPIVFFADLLRRRRQHGQSIALLEFDDEAPFVATPSKILLPAVPNGVIACMPLLEDWGIASRIASTTDQPGTFDGSLVALADYVLAHMPRDDAGAITFVAAGTNEFVERLSTLREKYRIQQERVHVCTLSATVASQ